VKAFETIIFNPGTLGRTWGTRPVSESSGRDDKLEGGLPTKKLIWTSM
jgi:hypothetical protein